MHDKLNFGELSSQDINIGDIVEWSKWNEEKKDWDHNYGIIMNIQNEVRSNRMVSISKVMPLNDSQKEIEFFTLSLRVISPSAEIKD